MDLTKALMISASGLDAQGKRMRVISENLANADSMGGADGAPYRRKVISFRTEFDRQAGVNLVKAEGVGVDRSEFGRKYDPGHPNADANGFVLTSNVKPLIEMQDMREAQRSYEANLNMIAVTKEMLQATISLLRN